MSLQIGCSRIDQFEFVTQANDFRTPTNGFEFQSLKYVHRSISSPRQSLGLELGLLTIAIFNRKFEDHYGENVRIKLKRS